VRERHYRDGGEVMCGCIYKRLPKQQHWWSVPHVCLLYNVIQCQTQISFNEALLVGEMLCFMTQLFTSRRTIGVNGESHNCLLSVDMCSPPHWVMTFLWIIQVL